MKSAEAFLLGRGYTKHPPYHNEHARALFQLMIREGKEEWSQGKRFINIWEYDLSRVFPQKESYSYTVEHTFETSIDNVWFKGEFYNLTADQVQKLLPELEEKLQTVFHDCKGEYQ